MYENNIKKILLIIIINLNFYDKNIFNIFKTYINFNKKKSNNSDIYNLKLFLNFCSNPNTKIRNFKIRRNPKISIISPIYNNEKFLMKFLKNLQYQNLKDIEIILVDDFSKDNSTKIIKQFQRKDKRIFLIKNRKNKGTFIARNIGVLFSKGKYINIPDSDDILSKDILKNSYRLAKRFNYDIIRFNIVSKNGKIKFGSFVNSFKNRPIYQPELSYFLFHQNNNLILNDFYIYNKIIKREIFIKALNLINKYCLNLYMIYYEDGLINYFIHLSGKSFYFLKKVGYLYLRNSQSVTRKKNNEYKALHAKLLFIYLKFVFEYSKNNQYSKDSINAISYSFRIDFKDLNSLSKLNFNKDIFFYKNIIDTFLNCEFINKLSKKFIKNAKEILKRKSYKYFNKNIFYKNV